MKPDRSLYTQCRDFAKYCNPVYDFAREARTSKSGTHFRSRIFGISKICAPSNTRAEINRSAFKEPYASGAASAFGASAVPSAGFSAGAASALGASDAGAASAAGAAGASSAFGASGEASPPADFLST